MFPNLASNGKKTSQYQEADYQRMLAQNTAKMVDMLGILVKSNEQLVKKTDMLLKESREAVQASNALNRYSEEVNRQASEGIRLMKKIGRKLIEHQSTTPNSENRDTAREDQRSPGKLPPLSESQTILQPQAMLSGTQNLRLQKKSMFNEAFSGGFEKDEGNPQNLQVIVKLNGINQGLSNLRKQVNVIKQQANSQTNRLDFPSIRQAMENKENTTFLNLAIKTWIGDLFRYTSDLSYSRYAKHDLGENETRLFFCQTIILNLLDFLDFMHKKDRVFWIQNQRKIMDLCSESARKILGFLKTKYPRNAVHFKSLQFEKLVKRINNSEDPRYDIMKNVGILFDVKNIEKGEVHYVREMKLFFNRLITLTQQQYQNYHEQMVKIFTGGKETKAKYLIGKKFKDNIPQFTESQLNSLDFKCKSPEILRILIKWLEEIQEVVNNPGKIINNKKAFKQFEMKKKESVPMSETIREKLIKHLKSKSKQIQENNQKNHTILSDLFDDLCQLTSEKPKGVEFLNMDDVKAIKFSQLVSSCLPFLTVNRIEYITSVFRTLQTEYSSNIEGKIDLLTFSVFDLLRSKCTGTKQQIMDIYKRLEESTYLNLIRVKNRLDTPMNDILINCSINKKDCPIISEIQLIITNENMTEKSIINDHFNHFLYELERSMFGPFSEACMIMAASDPRMQYSNELKKILMKMNRLTQEEAKKIQIEDTTGLCDKGHKMIPLHFSLPFVCCLCSSFNNQYASAFNGLECDDCRLKICPACIFLAQKNPAKRLNKYMANVSLPLDFFEDQFFELARQEDKDKKTFQKLIMDIMTQNNRQFAMLLRFSNGIVSRYGLRNLVNKNMLVPTYFMYKKEFLSIDKIQKYDVLLLVKNSNIEIFQRKALLKEKNIEMLTEGISLEALLKASEKRVICSILDNRKLLCDFEDIEADIQRSLEDFKVTNIIQECIVSQLTTLNISSREMTDLAIVQPFVNSLSHVLSIGADDNKLESIDIFYKFKNLVKLSLKNNLVSSDRYSVIDFNHNPNFLDLFMAKNNFKKMPIVRANKCTRISFKANKMNNVDNLPKCQFNDLIELGVAQNQIEAFPPFNNKSLEKFICKSNLVTSLEFLTSSQLPNLTDLDFESNELKIVPTLNYARMKNVRLADNNLVDLKWLSQSTLPSLEQLDLSNNNIVEMADFKSSTLKKLKLNNNNIANMDFLKTSFINVKQADLSNNNIKDVPYLNLPKLVKLSLKKNCLSKFIIQEVEGEKKCFPDSRLPELNWLSIFAQNKFAVAPILLMEFERVFPHAAHIE